IYSNIQSTEGHAYGIEVELWRSGNSLFGLLFYAEGLMGDAPRGVLQEVSYLPDTRQFSFTTKLSRGLHYCQEHNNVPSRDVVQFSGILYADSLIGTMTLIDSLDAKIVSSERFELRKSDTGTEEQKQWKFQDVADWTKRYWEGVHRSRGPKW
ncbi:MAG: hypothetical protein ACRDGA_13590, partial [Bacteroidota bacterium]